MATQARRQFHCVYGYKTRIAPGDNLIMVAFGAGFTWAGAYITGSCGR
jgi:hypothetical protein